MELDKALSPLSYRDFEERQYDRLLREYEAALASFEKSATYPQWKCSTCGHKNYDGFHDDDEGFWGQYCSVRSTTFHSAQHFSDAAPHNWAKQSTYCVFKRISNILFGFRLILDLRLSVLNVVVQETEVKVQHTPHGLLWPTRQELPT